MTPVAEISSQALLYLTPLFLIAALVACGAVARRRPRRTDRFGSVCDHRVRSKV